MIDSHAQHPPSFWLRFRRNPLLLGLGLPTAVCALGVLASSAFGPPGAYLLLLWPIATIVGLVMGCISLMERLFATRLATSSAFAILCFFVLVCLSLQAATAVVLGRSLSPPPAASPDPVPMAGPPAPPAR